MIDFNRRPVLPIDGAYSGIFTGEQRGKWAYGRLWPDTLFAIAALITPEP